MEKSSMILNLKIQMKYLTFWYTKIVLRFINYVSITMKDIPK